MVITNDAPHNFRGRDGCATGWTRRSLLGAYEVNKMRLTLEKYTLQRIRRIPAAGEHFEWRGLRFEVVDMDRRRIDKVLAQPARERNVS